MKWEKIMVDFGAGKIPLIGYIVGVTKRAGEMPYNIYVEWCKSFNIPEEEMVSKPKPEAALKMALKEMEGIVYENIPDFEWYKIKHSVKQASKNEYFLVQEIIARKKLTSDATFDINKKRTFRIKLNLKSNEVIVVENIENPSEKDEVLWSKLYKRYVQLMNSIPSEYLVENLKYLIKNKWYGISYTAAKSVFFVPIEYANNLEIHKNLFDEFAKKYNKGSHYKTQIRTLPCIDSDEQRKYLADDVASEIEARIKGLIVHFQWYLKNLVEKYLERGDPGESEKMIQSISALIERQKELNDGIEELQSKYSELLNTKIEVDFEQYVTKENITDMNDRFQAVLSMLEDDDAKRAFMLYQDALKVLGLSKESQKKEVTRFAQIVSQL